MTVRPRAPWRGALASGIAAVALMLAACSSPTTSTPSASGGAVPASVTSAVDAAVKGTSGALPTSSPKAVGGHKLWIVSGFQQVQALAYLATELTGASKALGWTASTCDGQNNANGGWATCVRQGIASGADTIVLLSVDCAPVKEALAAAKAAKITIAAISGFDCSDPSQGGSAPMFDTQLDYGNGIDSVADFFTESGKVRADYIIRKTHGAAKILHVEFKGVAIGDYLSKGFTDEIAAKCPGCSVVNTVAITPADIPQLRQKFESGLLQAAGANAIVVDLGFMTAAGIQQSIVSSGSAKNRVVLGGECTADEIGYLHAGGGIQACIGISNGRAAWALADELNRYFAGEKPVAENIGMKLLDADSTDLPAAGENYVGPLDYEAGYTKLWAGK